MLSIARAFVLCWVALGFGGATIMKYQMRKVFRKVKQVLLTEGEIQRYRITFLFESWKIFGHYKSFNISEFLKMKISHKFQMNIRKRNSSKFYWTPFNFIGLPINANIFIQTFRKCNFSFLFKDFFNFWIQNVSKLFTCKVYTWKWN